MNNAHNNHSFGLMYVCVCVCEDDYHASKNYAVILCTSFAFMSCFHAQVNVCSALCVFSVYTDICTASPLLPLMH